MKSWEDRFKAANPLRSKTLKGCLDKVSEEKTRIVRDLEDFQAKNEDLIFQQKNMTNSAFERIMTDVWSVDPRLVI